MLSQELLLTILQTTKKLKLLYVEDNEESSFQALKVFRNYFDHIDIAVDGKFGLQTYIDYHIDTNRYYDLVITDVNMPNMDGIEMSRAIYKINKSQKIIVVSAYSNKQYFIDLINLGVEAFMQKPLSLENTMTTLSKFCEIFRESFLIDLSKDYMYNTEEKSLFFNKELIKTTINENMFLEFLIKNKNNPSSLEGIFNHIYYDQPQKEFSSNSIKGLVKRLRKKLPLELIIYCRTKGYTLKC